MDPNTWREGGGAGHWGQWEPTSRASNISHHGLISNGQTEVHIPMAFCPYKEAFFRMQSCENCLQSLARFHLVPDGIWPSRKKNRGHKPMTILIRYQASLGISSEKPISGTLLECFWFPLKPAPYIGRVDPRKQIIGGNSCDRHSMTAKHFSLEIHNTPDHQWKVTLKAKSCES